MPIIFWGSRKLFSCNERGLRRALKHPLLADKPVIGRGVYSLVLANNNSVLKLTIDRSAYALAELQSQWRCSGLPAIRALHGTVGETDGGNPLFLIEMEHLQRLKTGSPARSRCLSLSRQLRRRLKEGETLASRLRKVKALQPNDGVGQALSFLAEYMDSQWPSTELDLHASNFMWRQQSSQIVITDPLMDMETRGKVQSAFLSKQGLSPEETLFLY